MRLAISRLDIPITAANRLYQSRKSAGLRPSNVLSPLMALANEVLLMLDSPMKMMTSSRSMYQVAVHSDVLYDIGTCCWLYRTTH